MTDEKILQPQLGIFWVKKISPKKFSLVDFYKTPDTPQNLQIAETEISRDAKIGHYEYWQKSGREKFLPYEKVPRGRVLFNKVAGTYFVFAGSWAFSDKKCEKPLFVFVRLIEKEFSLPKENTKFLRDEHYEARIFP